MNDISVPDDSRFTPDALENHSATSQVWSTPEFIEELSPQNPELVVELIQLYLEDTANELHALREHVFRQDKPAALKSLHGLKGSCRQIGGLRLGALIEELENRFEGVELEAARQSLREIETGFDMLRLELQCRMTVLEERSTPNHVRTDS